MQNTEHFIITTNGHTASKWLAKVISMHPAILCSHGAAELTISTSHEKEYTNQEKILQLTQEFRREMPLIDIFDELKKWDNKASVLGNVHMFNLRQLDANLKKNELLFNLNIVDLVRHPVAFVQSGYHNILSQCFFNKDRITYINNVKELNSDLYHKYADKYNLDLQSIEVLSFMANIMTMKSFELNFNLRNYINRFRMEDITTSKEAFKKLIILISGNNIEIKDSYIDDVMISIKTNHHDPSSIRKNEEEKFYLWEKWQQEMFIELIYLTNCKYNFENLGYNLSFL